MREARVSIGSRLGAYLGAYFLLLGVFVPFFPLWMRDRGLDAKEISWVLAALTFARIPFSPYFAEWADRLGRRVGLLRGLSLASLLAFGLLFFGHGFWAIFFISILFSALSSALLPLAENLILVHGWKNQVDFGRVRVFGSLAFLLSNLLAGWILDLLGAGWVWYLGIFYWLVVCATSLTLPEAAMPRGETKGSRIRALLSRRDFLLALLITGLIAGSHAVYYGHSATLWTDLGLSKTLIGTLWATGVLAEIVLFQFQRSWTGHLLPSQLMMLGAAGGALRWGLLSWTAEPWLLFPAQCLHALSFAASHLGMLRYLHRYLPKDQFATGQGLYSAIAMGLFLGTTFLFTGPIVDRFGLGAYLLPMTYCLTALVLGLWLLFLKKRRRGQTGHESRHESLQESLQEGGSQPT